MEIMIAVVVGLLVAAGSYLMMSGKLLPYIFGLVLLSNAGNMVIFSSGRLVFAAPPLIPEGAETPVGAIGNSLPQALILTAIVIGFGLMCFALTLSFRAHREMRTTRMDEMRVAEPVAPAEARR